MSPVENIADNCFSLSNKIIPDEMVFLLDMFGSCSELWSWQRIMAAWLSLNSSVGPFCVCPISLKKLQSHARCCPALLSPMYSDLVVESATILCCLLDQEMALQLLINKKLEVDRELSGSWDYPASEYPWKSKTIEISVPSNLSSMSFVAWIYLSIRFAASQ